ncbi:septum site-determining protein Ssd [Rhodococcus sp. NPDC058505]|uniref:septum site-determining protein Ssd n=1 Tax=Rhodococcus sp. NPDC058505 TaxID=3346531 RepID=UPI003666DE5C
MDTLGSGAPPVLAITVDDALAAGIRRAGAAAGRDVLEHRSVVPRGAWVGAAHIVVDRESAKECARSGLPRRAGIHLVCSGPPDLPDWRVATEVGAQSVLDLPAAEADLVSALARRVEGRDGSGPVVAVIGGRGGAGASTLAAAVALTGAARFPDSRSLLVDCDVLGGGLDLLLGAEHRPGLRWQSLHIEGGAVSASALHAALPSVGGGVSVLSWDRGPDRLEPGDAALRAVIEAGRAAGDVVVCDVPRHSRGVTETVVSLADALVVVVGAQVRAVAAAEALLTAIRGRHPNLVAVVRGPSPGGLSGTEVEELLGVPVVAAIRPEPRLDVTLEQGGLRLRGRSPLRRAATSVLDLVSAAGGAS